MAGPSNTVANAAPIPTNFFPGANIIQMQARGNNGSTGSHAVDYPVNTKHILPVAIPQPSQVRWPWETWAPLLKTLRERLTGG